MSVVEPPPRSEGEKKRLIRQQLFLLLHAEKCSSLEVPGEENLCEVLHCDMMRVALKHMMTCTDGNVCAFSHCATSRLIIGHFKECKSMDCSICHPVTGPAILKSSPKEGTLSVNMQCSTPPEVEYAMRWDLTLVLHARVCSRTEHNYTTEQPVEVKKCPMPHCDSAQLLVKHMKTCRNGNYCQYERCVVSRKLLEHWSKCESKDCQLCSPLKSIIASNQTKQGISDLDPFKVSIELTTDTQTSNSLNEVLYWLGNTVLTSTTEPLVSVISNPHVGDMASHPPNPNDLTDYSVIPHNSPKLPSWFAEVSLYHRLFLINQTVKNIFPLSYKVMPTDLRMIKLQAYAANVEVLIWEKAKSRAEYMQLLTDVIVEVQQKMEDKRATKVMAQANVLYGDAKF